MRPNSLEELWAFMGTAVFGLGPETRVVWRGLPSATFNISSSLLRRFPSGEELNEANFRAKELEILDLARAWDIGLDEHGSASDLHLLSKLQHHGAPTRLIDVTYNPITALWFACSDRSFSNHDGILAVLTVTDVPQRISSEHPRLTYDTMAVPWTASLVSALRKARGQHGVVLVEPRPRDDRMKAQEGLFITGVIPEKRRDGPIAGLSFSSLAKMLPLAMPSLSAGAAKTEGGHWEGLSVAGIVVSPELKQQLLPILDRTFNRSHRTMYPDVPGFVDALRAGHLDGDGTAIRFSDPDEANMPRYWED